MYTNLLSSPNQFVPEIVSPSPFSSELVRHTLLFVYLFKEIISFIGSLDKCHTNVFNALIFKCGTNERTSILDRRGERIYESSIVEDRN